MIPILFEDNHCLAVNKPAGLLSQGDATGDRAVVDIVRDDLKFRYAKPGNVYVGLIHRLDRPVSGVLLLAKTSKAAARLSAQFHERVVAKKYVAVVEGSIDFEAGEWTDSLLKDESTNRVRVVSSAEGARASLAYRVLEQSRGQTLVELRPTTGRGHQLRVQLASRGLPIIGDKKYGAKTSLRASDGGYRIALHAIGLEFNHPTREERIVVESPWPNDWPTAFQKH
jgi:23S rRNA pseudouridine1911/1915/1917 synthase